MKTLSELFTVTYGNKLDLNKMMPQKLSRGGVNFVGRSSQNHGVSGTVQTLSNIKPYDEGLITVALGGSKLLSSFVQEHAFYTSQNVAVLSPKFDMTYAEKLYICICIRHNRFRYSAFGREANRTLRSLLVPESNEFPEWVYQMNTEQLNQIENPANQTEAPIILNAEQWEEFELNQLFELKKGKRLTKSDMTKGSIPYIGAIDSNNGISAYVGQDAIHTGQTITVSYNGSVAEAFYQPEDFWATDDVNVLYPKFEMTAEIGLFLCTLIRKEKYRFNYGRKWHLERMKESVIRLPTTENGEPDWNFMERYIKSLPFSSQLS